MYSMKIQATNIIDKQGQPLISPLSSKIILVTKPEEITADIYIIFNRAFSFNDTKVIKEVNRVNKS